MDGGSCTIADTEVAEFFAILDREGAFFRGKAAKQKGRAKNRCIFPGK